MRRLTNRAAAVVIIKRLRSAGHEALLAGGCVRDMRMRRRPKDYDVATDATPKRVMQLFKRTRKVGVQFGVVIVGLDREWVEVATFRTDLDYADGRHPTRVVFGSAREDASRRDFTVNGMFYDPLAGEVFDYVGGERDLERRVIRAIGDPDKRFEEDHLRMVRAVRFATRLDFCIARGTYRAIKRRSRLIGRISAERIREELELVLCDPRRAVGLALLAETGLLTHLWPGDDWRGERVVLVEKLLGHLPRQCSFELALAGLLYGVEPKRADEICRALAASNLTRQAVVWLLRNQAVLEHPDKLSLADLKLLMQNDRFDELLVLLKARLRAEGRPGVCYRQLRRRSAGIDPGAVAPRPLVDGHDLMAMGLKPGPQFTRLLNEVYRRQLDEEVRTRKAAVAMVRARAGLGPA